MTPRDSTLRGGSVHASGSEPSVTPRQRSGYGRLVPFARAMLRPFDRRGPSSHDQDHRPPDDLATSSRRSTRLDLAPTARFSCAPEWKDQQRLWATRSTDVLYLASFPALWPTPSSPLLAARRCCPRFRSPDEGTDAPQAAPRGGSRRERPEPFATADRRPGRSGGAGGGPNANGRVLRRLGGDSHPWLAPPSG